MKIFFANLRIKKPRVISGLYMVVFLNSSFFSLFKKDSFNRIIYFFTRTFCVVIPKDERITKLYSPSAKLATL